MDLLQQTEKLKEYIKDLDVSRFEELYTEIDDPYDLPECMVTEIFKHYPEILCNELEITTTEFDLTEFYKNKDAIINKMNSFFDILIDNGFMFDDNILSKRFDEVIHFHRLYDSIGLDQPNSFGNTLLHMQVRGLHTEGVKFLIEKGATLNIYNAENKNPFEILFLDQFIAYKNHKSLEKKFDIAKILIESNVDFDRFINEKGIFERTLYATFAESSGCEYWNIDNLKLLKHFLLLEAESINIY